MLIVSVSLICKVIQLLLLVLCIFLISKIIKRRFIDQRCLWGILRSCGMTVKNAVLQNMCENIFLAAVSVSLCFILLAVVNSFGIRQFELTLFDFVGIFSFTVVVLSITAQRYISKIFKTPIIQQINISE